MPTRRGRGVAPDEARGGYHARQERVMLTRRGGGAGEGQCGQGVEGTTVESRVWREASLWRKEGSGGESKERREEEWRE